MLRTPIISFCAAMCLAVSASAAGLVPVELIMLRADGGRSTMAPAAVTPGGATAAASTAGWSSVRRWGYQLQDPSVATVAQSPTDVVVIDYSRDGSHESRFTRADLARMQQGPDGRRLVVAYMSIGEAENYRYYWQSWWRPGNPSFLLAENPDWEGNYKVNYWDPGWQRLIFGTANSYFDTIVDAGFDGVYLDIVDGYEAFGTAEAKERMIGFVLALADYARVVKGKSNFGIFPQNAPELLSDRRYLAAVTGIGVEEIYFDATDEATDGSHRATRERQLSAARQAGKLILTVDYCSNSSNQQFVAQRTRQLGFVSITNTRELDRLFLTQN